MRSDILVALTAALAPLASAHYSFSGLLVNGQMVGREWQYVREHQRSYMPTFRDEAATSNDFRCNKGAGSGANTDVYTVKPGDEVALRQAFDPSGMAHPGPTQIYVSKAPSSVKDYDGSGDWIKVHQGLICKENPTPEDLRSTAWCMWKKNNIGFKVPDALPNGEYLVRVEHIALHGAHDGKAEFYYACGQIKIEGSSATSMPNTPSTKIPGVYKVNDAAINFSIWGTSKSYDFMPGIDVAVGEIVGSKDGSSSGTKYVGAKGSSGSNNSSGSQSSAAAPQPTASQPSAAAPQSSKAAQPSSAAPQSTEAAQPTAAPGAPGSDYPDYPDYSDYPAPGASTPTPEATTPTPVISTPKPSAPVAVPTPAAPFPPAQSSKPSKGPGRGCRTRRRRNVARK